MWSEKGACDSRHVLDRVLAEHFDGNAAVEFWTGPGQPEPGQSRIANRRQHLADAHDWPTVDELGKREDMFATTLAQRHDFAPPLPAMQRRARDAEFLLQIGRPGNLTAQSSMRTAWRSEARSAMCLDTGFPSVDAVLSQAQSDAAETQREILFAIMLKNSEVSAGTSPLEEQIASRCACGRKGRAAATLPAIMLAETSASASSKKPCCINACSTAWATNPAKVSCEIPSSGS